MYLTNTHSFCLYNLHYLHYDLLCFQAPISNHVGFTASLDIHSNEAERQAAGVMGCKLQNKSYKQTENKVNFGNANTLSYSGTQYVCGNIRSPAQLAIVLFCMTV